MNKKTFLAIWIVCAVLVAVSGITSMTLYLVNEELLSMGEKANDSYITVGLVGAFFLVIGVACFIKWRLCVAEEQANLRAENARREQERLARVQAEQEEREKQPEPEGKIVPEEKPKKKPVKKGFYTQKQIEDIKLTLHYTPLGTNVVCPLCQKTMSATVVKNIMGYGMKRRQVGYKVNNYNSNAEPVYDTVPGFQEFVPVYRCKCEKCSIVVQGPAPCKAGIYPVGEEAERKYNMFNLSREQMMELRPALEGKGWDAFLK